MSEPVLVVHGVANRSQKEFQDRVAELGQRLGSNEWSLVPVFWGDLGADDDLDLLGSIPTVRSDEDNAEFEMEDFLANEISGLLGSTTEVRATAISDSSELRKDLVVKGWEEWSEHPDSPVRGGGGSGSDSNEIQQVLDAEWASTRCLQHIDDPVMLTTVGHVLAASAVTSSRATEQATTGFEVRGDVEETVEVRGSVSEALKSTLEELDSLVGRAVGKIVGRQNQRLRRNLAPGIVRFVGDIIAYTARQEEIHCRFWDAIEGWKTETGSKIAFGTEAHPVNVIAHSLGGVASFDLAMKPEHPVFIKNFITFGSQAALFHSILPRPGVTPYAPGYPVRLPGPPVRIQTWTNLWDPMDLVAFATEGVFLLPDHSTQTLHLPKDVQIDSGIGDILGSKLWTHSLYWESEELLSTIKSVLSGKG